MRVGFLFNHSTPHQGLNFAPHIVLFRRNLRHRAFLPRRFRGVRNIHIDTGSELSVDMTYMPAADIYLGDVSSQVYEFLLNPRPCIFLNGNGVDWRDNPCYVHWHLGQVVGNVPGELPQAMAQAFPTHAEFLPRQHAVFDYTFFRDPGRTAAQVGADAIADYLDRSSAPGSKPRDRQLHSTNRI
ncbi:MAG: hypothetical protein HYY48_04405 [Gammaproteobacteria bacterium]|nr:hypothetical protein [Gammaproteobacteria bacterium]